MVFIIKKTNTVTGQVYFLSSRIVSSIRGIDFTGQHIKEQIYWKEQYKESDFKDYLIFINPDLKMTIPHIIKEAYPMYELWTDITVVGENEVIDIFQLTLSETKVDESNIDTFRADIAKSKLTSEELELISPTEQTLDPSQTL